MSKFIKISVTKQMTKDLKECADMADHGESKDCEGCSLNGGYHECLAEQPWREDFGQQ